MTAVRVAVVDDNPIVRMGLLAVLGDDPGIEVCAEAGNGAEAVDLVRRERPDVVLLDVRMPGSDGLSVLPNLVERARVVMLTHSEEPEMIARALAAGAIGYLVHGNVDSTELVQSVRDAAAGQMRLSPVAAAVLARTAVGAPPLGPASPGPSATAGPDGWDAIVARHRLSRREVEVCRELVKGRSNRAIAQSLYIEPKTVKNHLNNVFAKLGVTTRAAAVATLLGTAEDPHDAAS